MRPQLLLRTAVGSVAGLGLIAALGNLVGRRSSSAAWERGVELTVTNPEDRGPGSLREAIFAANLATDPTRIVILVPRLTLLTPLPPAVARRGIEIVAADSNAEIDAEGLQAGPVLDVRSPGVHVRGLRIRGAGGVGILVGAPGARLDRVDFVRCGVGLEQLADGGGLTVEEATFRQNSVGARLRPSGEITAIRRSRFQRNSEAGVWAVGGGSATAPSTGRLVVSDSRFEDNQLGMVVGNLMATIQDNDISGSREAGIYLAGRGATVRRNRVRGGARVGVLAALTEAAVITDNEIDHNSAVGIVVNSARNTVVQDNRVYQNGYGIVVAFGAGRSPNRVTGNSVLAHSWDGLFVVGGSPVLERNRATNNRLAGMRILDFRPPRGASLVADPLLAQNTLEGNGVNQPVHGVFREAR
jgi:parallel beta-helix repeat protein